MLSCVVGPITEEFCFRGVILNRLLNWTPTWVAVSITSFLFGLAHLNLLQSMYAFVFGFAFSLVYLRFRTIWAPIILHAACNATNSFLVGSELPYLPFLMVSAVLSGCFAWLLSRRPVATTDSLSLAEQ
jgi:membrane protease YdiL (CAAX protease family)